MPLSHPTPPMYIAVPKVGIHPNSSQTMRLNAGTPQIYGADISKSVHDLATRRQRKADVFSLRKCHILNEILKGKGKQSYYSVSFP